MSGRSFGGNKPKSAKIEAPSLPDSGGYNAKRQEFDPEYDNDAEQLLADMEFKETDTEVERELKLRVLRIYSKRYCSSDSKYYRFWLSILLSKVYE